MERMIVWLAAEALDELARLDDLLRVEAGRRLVEDQHVRVVEDRLREADALAVALRELADQLVPHVADAALLDRVRRPAALRSFAGTPLILAQKSRYSRDAPCRGRAAASRAGSRRAA